MCRKTEHKNKATTGGCDPGNSLSSTAGPVQVLVLKKEMGCTFEEITIDDFEMQNYTPMKPQLKFDLGI